MENANSLNTTVLQTWIHPQHLESNVLKWHRDTFLTNPARLITIQNFLQPDVAGKLNSFLSDEAMFRAEYGLYSTEEAVSEEEYLCASDSDRLFKLHRLTGARPQSVMSPNALTYLRFRQTFQQTAFREFFEAISGLQLANSDDFGSHMMVKGDYLKPHSDDNRNRRLALIIYLSRDWEPHFGGVFHLMDTAGRDIEIVPQYNLMVAFDVLVNASHSVTPIENGVRLSIGGWYRKPNAQTHVPVV